MGNMSIRVGIRFRPVRPLGTTEGWSGDPVAAGKQRWAAALGANPEVVGFQFGPQPLGVAPIERQVAAMFGSVTPVDLTIEWTSLQAANELIGDDDSYVALCGIVACAPATQVEGQPVMMFTP
jgi:hypothetical protein